MFGKIITKVWRKFSAAFHRGNFKKKIKERNTSPTAFNSHLYSTEILPLYNERPVCILTFNPALPSVSHSLQKHWRVMISDPYLKQVFSKPPMVAFRRTQNLRSKLIKAKVPPPPPKRKKKRTVGHDKM